MRGFLEGGGVRCLDDGRSARCREEERDVHCHEDEGITPSITAFSPTRFIDCITCILDALTLHLPFYNCPSMDRAYSLLATHAPSLVRCTPSFLLSLSHFPPLATPLCVHLSGELLHATVLAQLRRFLPRARFFNVYGGCGWLERSHI